MTSPCTRKNPKIVTINCPPPARTLSVRRAVRSPASRVRRPRGRAAAVAGLDMLLCRAAWLTSSPDSSRGAAAPDRPRQTRPDRQDAVWPSGSVCHRGALSQRSAVADRRLQRAASPAALHIAGMIVDCGMTAGPAGVCCSLLQLRDRAAAQFSPARHCSSRLGSVLQRFRSACSLHPLGAGMHGAESSAVFWHRPRSSTARLSQGQATFSLSSAPHLLMVCRSRDEVDEIAGPKQLNKLQTDVWKMLKAARETPGGAKETPGDTSRQKRRRGLVSSGRDGVYSVGGPRLQAVECWLIALNWRASGVGGVVTGRPGALTGPLRAAAAGAEPSDRAPPDNTRSVWSGRAGARRGWGRPTDD